MNVLTVKDLKKSYRKGFFLKPSQVLHGVSFNIAQGSITGFLGGNGAGKTTTIKCLLELAFPQSGEILYFGNQPISSDVKRKIGFLPENPYFYDYLTGEEFLKFYGQISTHLSRKDLSARIQSLLKKVDMTHAKDRPLRSYSKGMMQKIGLAQALVHDPELVILDEPMTGLDPDGRYYLAELIKETARSGKTVFFSSHLLHDTEQLCENLVILSSGKVVYEGSTEKLLNNNNKPYHVSYSLQGKKHFSKVATLQEMQKELDQLRHQNAEIYDVRQERSTLEEAFVNIALRGPKS